MAGGRGGAGRRGEGAGWPRRGRRGFVGVDVSWAGLVIFLARSAPTFPCLIGAGRCASSSLRRGLTDWAHRLTLSESESHGPAWRRAGGGAANAGRGIERRWHGGGDAARFRGLAERQVRRDGKCGPARTGSVPERVSLNRVDYETGLLKPGRFRSGPDRTGPFPKRACPAVGHKMQRVGVRGGGSCRMEALARHGKKHSKKRAHIVCTHKQTHHASFRPHNSRDQAIAQDGTTISFCHNCWSHCHSRGKPRPP